MAWRRDPSPVSHVFAERVTQYHAQVGPVDRTRASELRRLEDSLLDDAEGRMLNGRFEEALDEFAHALAVCEKVPVAGDGTTTQALIVFHMASCLHHLGELEAAAAYYEQAIEGVRRTTPPKYERMLISAVSRLSGIAPPDDASSRVEFIESRIREVNEGHAPAALYRGEYGPSRWTSLARKRAARHTGRRAAFGEAAQGVEDSGQYARHIDDVEPTDDERGAASPLGSPRQHQHRDQQWQPDGTDYDGDGDGEHVGMGARSGFGGDSDERDGRGEAWARGPAPPPPPPSSNRGAALMGAIRAKHAPDEHASRREASRRATPSAEDIGDHSEIQRRAPAVASRVPPAPPTVPVADLLGNALTASADPRLLTAAPAAAPVAADGELLISDDDLL